MRQYKKLRFFTFAFALLIAICSCEKQDITNHILTEQLELSTYDISKMSEKDFKLIGKAIQRLDITRDQYGFYTIKQTSGAQINISEELFKFVKAGYEHTNQIIYSDLCSVDSTFLSTKSQYPLPPDDGPKNCVAHALAGMGGVTYEQALSYIYSLGYFDGVPEDALADIVHHFYPYVYECDSSIFDPEGDDIVLHNALIWFKTSDNTGHAVNAVVYDAESNTIISTDAQNNNHINFINPSQMVSIFMVGPAVAL